MNLFLSTYCNKVDIKGRVSVPSAFRDIIEKAGFNGIIVNKSPLNECIEASCISRMENISSNINSMESISAEIRDAFATFFLGNSFQLQFDSDGRIVVSKKLLESVNISDKAIFIGKGKIFEIWNPEKFEEYKEKIQKIVHQNKLFFDLQKT